MEIQLAAQPFIENAVNTSGLEDFGGNTFEQGLETLINSLNIDLGLDPEREKERVCFYFNRFNMKGDVS